MEKLTGKQLFDVRFALSLALVDARSRKNTDQIERYEQLLEILEPGCGVDVFSCEEETVRYLKDQGIDPDDECWEAIKNGRKR